MIIQLIIFGAIGSLPFLKGLNEAENLSKCGDEAPCPRVFLHMTTHVFWERIALFALLRAKPSSPSSYQSTVGLAQSSPVEKVVCQASAARCTPELG